MKMKNCCTQCQHNYYYSLKKDVTNPSKGENLSKILHHLNFFFADQFIILFSVPPREKNHRFLPSCVLLLDIRMSMCRSLVTHTKQLLWNVNTGLEVCSWKCHDMGKISDMKRKKRRKKSQRFCHSHPPAWSAHNRILTQTTSPGNGPWIS